MQLARTPITNGADWHASTPLPRSLPAATSVVALDRAPTFYSARVGHRNEFGTEQMELGIQNQGWLTHGSFDEAVAAARDLSKALPPIWSGNEFDTGTLGIVKGHAGWLLLRVGSGITDDRLSSPFEFTPATGAAPAVMRKTDDTLLAVVSPTRWIDFRDVAAS
jgi:hypothetical protein